MPVVEFIRRLLPSHRKQLQAETFGDETAMRILERADAEALQRLLLSISGSWSDRYFYSLSMSRSFPMGFLEQWAEAEPTSADAHLIYGARLLKWSWEARGYGRGKEVSTERWVEFYERLELTRGLLELSARLHPADPTPWVYLIMVAVYAGDGADRQQAYFEEAIERDPESWAAHMHRLTGLTKKYGGSHAQMFEFARRIASEAKPGSLLPALLAKAHSEYWKYLAVFEGDHEQAKRHMLDRSACEETREAYHRALSNTRYERRATIFARINAAGWFWLARDREILRNELRELGDSIHDIHWRWVGTEGTLSGARDYAEVE